MHQMKEEPTAPTLPARPPSFRSHQTRPRCPKLRTTPSRYPPPLRLPNFCTRQLIPAATNNIHQQHNRSFRLASGRPRRCPLAAARGRTSSPSGSTCRRRRGTRSRFTRRERTKKSTESKKKSFSKTILQHFIFQSPTPAHLLRNHLRRLRCQDRGDPPRQDVRQRPEVPRGNPGRRRRRSVRPGLPSDGDRFLLDSPGRIRVQKS